MAVVDIKAVALTVANRVILHAKVIDITIADHPTYAEFELEDPLAAGDTPLTITCDATRAEKTSTPA